MAPRANRRLGAFALLASVWLFAGLFGRDPWKPDEAYTFGLVHSILQTGDWTVPMLAGEPFMEKPPLFFVTGALFASLFDGLLPIHDGARLATAFYSSLTLLFVSLSARRLFGRDAALPAALAMMGCIGYFHTAHLLVTDNALVAGTAMGLYGIARAREEARWGGLLLGTGAGIAFLSKGLIGPGMLGLTALALAGMPAFRTPCYLRALGVAALAAAPWAIVWPLALYQRSPELFHEWFVVNNLGRYTGSALLGPERDHWMYLRILPWFAFPALPLAAWALWRAYRERDRAIAMPLAAALVMLGVLSSARNSRYLYALPMLVPLSILAGAACRSVPLWLERALFRAAVAACAIVLAALWLGWGALLAQWPGEVAGALLRWRPGFESAFQPGAVVAAAGVSIAGLFALRMLARGPAAAPAAWAVAAAMGWTVFFTLWLPYMEYGNSYRSVTADLSAHIPPGAGCIANRDLGEPQRAMFEYFGGLVTVAEAAPAASACPLLLVQQGRDKAGVPFAPDRVAIWSGARPGDTNERFWLLASRPLVAAAGLRQVSGTMSEP